MSRYTKNRICPDCARNVFWATKKRGSARPVKCVDVKGCGWRGPFYNSIPVPKRKIRPSKRKEFLKAMSDALDSEVSGRKAIDDFENHTLSHPYADPSPDGNEEMSMYIDKLTQIRLLQAFVEVVGIEEKWVKDLILRNEVERLFPNHGKVIRK